MIPYDLVATIPYSLQDKCVIKEPHLLRDCPAGEAGQGCYVGLGRSDNAFAISLVSALKQYQLFTGAESLRLKDQRGKVQAHSFSLLSQIRAMVAYNYACRQYEISSPPKGENISAFSGALISGLW